MSDQREDVSTIWSHFDLPLSPLYLEFHHTPIFKEHPFLFSPFALSPFGEMAPQSTLFGDANCHRETDRGGRNSVRTQFGME